mgnify:FL=1
MIHGGIERGEVVVGGVDHGAGLDGIADTAEDVLGLLDDLLDQVLVTDLRSDARQRDVDGLVLECVLEAAAFISVVRSSSMPSISWRISLARLPSWTILGASLPIMRISR